MISLEKILQMADNAKRQSEKLEQGRAPIYGWLYDSAGRAYRVLYRVIESSIKGNGPIVPSNQPGSFRETPGYPHAFQARSLERRAEKQKIQTISRKLDPFRLLAPHVDPTVGAPVTWLSHGERRTRPGWSYVLGGNGRTIAMLMASDKIYERYERMGKALWPEIWPDSPARPGMRHILVRQVFPPTCLRRDMDPSQKEARCRISFDEAVQLAGATQASMSARETPLGEALSLVRSFGLDPVTIAREMPPFRWDKAIARDTVEDFLSDPDTRALTHWLKGLLGDGWTDRTGDPDNAAELVQSMMIGFLPRDVVMEGFRSEREERALMAALPFLAQIAIGVGRGDMGEEWDLLDNLAVARRFLDGVRGKSFRATMNQIDRMANQEVLGLQSRDGEAIQTLAQQLTPQAVLLALVLKRGEQARDPSVPVEDVFRRYLRAAREAPGPRQIMLGGYQKQDIPLHLGRALAESMRGDGAPPIRVRTYQQARNKGLF